MGKAVLTSGAKKETMTGRDLSSRYKETARGGLALVEKF